MNTTENNKLISKFMCWDIQNSTTIPTNLHLSNLELDNGDVMEIKCHSSWDWLMPVVEKILCLTQYEDESYEDIHSGLKYALLNQTYNAVVEFIKRHNKI
tara:strand:+ start:140 stop:439 length:300 start_codon:yes stop_codon:yes gene_type:complete